ARQSSRENRRMGPCGSVESRTAALDPMAANSTQPPLSHHRLLRQAGMLSSISVLFTLGLTGGDTGAHVNAWPAENQRCTAAMVIGHPPSRTRIRRTAPSGAP